MNVNQENTTLPVLPLRGLTVFPHMLLHFDVGRMVSLRALEEAMKAGKQIFLTTQKSLRDQQPAPEELFEVGTICTVKQILRLSGENVRVLVEGHMRAHAAAFSQMESGLITAEVEPLPEFEGSARRTEALMRTLQDQFRTYVELMPPMPNDVLLTIAAGGPAGYLADYIAQHIDIHFEQKQSILEELTISRRLHMLIRILMEENEILRIESDIQEELHDAVEKNQREYYLREQMKIIQNELGDQDVYAEADAYRQRIEALKLPEETAHKLLQEVDRMAKMRGAAAETAVTRTYLDTVLELPWNTTTRERHDLARAEKILSRDHFGMDKVKERVLEFMAVKALAPGLKGQVLCLVGPPGVGKTSIARSIAEAMNRKYTRMSLGGVRDEADIRGHRKTYIGAMPGRIMNAMRQAGSRNPLILLDEIDKMGNDFRGDPASAMLEVLDTEQNAAFRDHYIEVPFDLSDVLFVTTANDLGAIPRPLLDRMEVIELPSYTAEEKRQIAARHLLPKQLKKHGLTKSMLQVPEETIAAVIAGYTREAGVRRLEQLMAKLCRKAARQIAAGEAKRVTIQPEALHTYLGAARYKQDNVLQTDEVGIVNGLAWTSVGGEMLQVEVAAVPGTGKIVVTGNLGKVMEESARAAVTYTRSRAARLGIDADFHQNTDIHIHFPEAAVPKDGPSAGITMATAIVSALTGMPVRHSVAMTGEVTLRGRVMPIGGLREKTMAAYRAGIQTIVIPKDNEADLDEVDPAVKAHVRFVPVDNMDAVLETAMDLSRRPAVQKKEPEHVELPMQKAGTAQAVVLQQ